MATDTGPGPYIKLPRKFPHHAKVAGLSDKAWRHLVTAWIFCSEHGTDGALTAGQAAMQFTPKTLREVREFYDPTPGGGYQFHEWERHQSTAALIADKSEKRAAAGREGGIASGKARATQQANGQQTRSNVEANGSANPKQMVQQTASKTEALEVRSKKLEVRTKSLEASLLKESRPTTPPTADDDPPTPPPRPFPLPADFAVDNEMILWARGQCPGITQRQLDLFHRRFQDYYEANARLAKGKKTNWLRTWQNWIETDFERARSSPGVNGGRPTVTDKMSRTLALGQQLQNQPTNYPKAINP